MDVVPILIGPTAIGKTAVSLQIAKQLPVEIISADSRQIYRYLDIGTAKSEPDILNKVPHHFINSLSPDEYFSAGMYGREARKVINQVLDRKNVPLIVGGSGFYIRALVDGLSEIDSTDEAVRITLQKRWENEGGKQLFSELEKVDPDLATKLEKNDKQRILRGLEVYHVSGNRLSALHQIEAQAADFLPLMIGLSADRKYLYNRINQRVDEMIKLGLVEEVQRLRQKGFSQNLNALNTVGYKEVFEYLDNNIDWEEMIGKIKQNSRRYAKRQLTWFRRDLRIRWLNIDEYKTNEQIAGEIIGIYRHSVQSKN